MPVHGTHDDASFFHYMRPTVFSSVVVCIYCTAINCLILFQCSADLPSSHTPEQNWHRSLTQSSCNFHIRDTSHAPEGMCACSAVKAGKFPEAVAQYTAALAACAEAGSPAYAAVLHSNRAAALQSQCLYAEAMADCLRSRSLDPMFTKVRVLASLLPQFWSSWLRMHHCLTCSSRSM